MMIALGLTVSRFVPPPCQALRCGGFQLVCAPLAEAGSPRDRMRLHLDCARRLPTLLPFAPAERTGAKQAALWCEAQRDRIEAALARLEGGRQLSLAAGPVAEAPAQPQAAGGADWLRRRAALLRERAQALERLRAGIGAACEGLAPRDRREDSRGDGLRLHLLVGREEAAAALERLRQGLAPVAGWSLTVSGPWPPYDFTDLGEVA